jgi:hypothetical protein
LLFTGIALVALAAPAGAQIPSGAQATPLVGVSPTANCPPTTPAAQVAGTFTSGGFTVGFPSAGSCTPLSANAQGSYTLTGATAGPLPFSSSCQNAGLQNGGGVDVPIGTVVNPGPGQVTTTAVTTITTPNTPVIFPGGTTAVLNQVTLTATSVTRSAIVAGGTIIGRVICGAANVYPLAVDTGASAPAPAVVTPLSASGGHGGPSTGLLLLGGGIAVVLLAQVVVALRIRRGQDGIGG